MHGSNVELPKMAPESLTLVVAKGLTLALASLTILADAAAAAPAAVSPSAVTTQPGRKAQGDVQRIDSSRSAPVVPAGIKLDEHGAAQPIRAYRGARNQITETLWVETEFDSDGDGELDRMYVDVTRPKATETDGLKVPVIYETSPYYWGVSGGGQEFFWDPAHAIGDEPPERPHPPEVKRLGKRATNSTSYVRKFVPRGFAVVHSASPGTGYSQGCPTIGGVNESLAPKAVIDWLCGRAKGFTEARGGEPVVADWCTGKVGMIGTSYNGTLPIAAACTGVEGLETIVPVAPNTSYYHYYRSNGLVRHPGGYMGEDIDVLYDFVNSGEPARRSWCNDNIRENILESNLDRVTGDYSDWWAARDYVNQLDKVKATVLMAHAFNDWNVMPEHSFRVRERLKELGVPTICYYHQGRHGGDPPEELLMRWFTRYLHGVENGVENGPKAYIARENSKRKEPTAYPDYPHPDATNVAVYPRGQGLSVGTLAESAGEGVITVIDDVSVHGAELATAQESEHRALFATGTLLRPVHFSGESTITLRVASDKEAVNLSVWIVSLPWNKRASMNSNENIITRGWADPQNAKSIRTGKPLKAGEYVDVTFRLQPDDQIIPVGERIGLMVFASDADFTLKPKPGTKLMIDLAGTKLQLPVVGGEGAWLSAFEL